MHANEEVIRTRYQLLAERDFAGLRAQLHPEVIWHVPGRNPHAGDHAGSQAVIAALRRIVDMSGGSSKVMPVAILADEIYVVTIEAGSARRGAHAIEVLNVSLFRMHEARIVEMWFLPGDQYAIDAFWD